MIWSEELAASLDQSAGVIVFHRVEVSRVQQLAQVIADKVGAMVEQNEKALDVKMGGTGGWSDRADGTKGDKRGEQAQERRGRSERTRGTARGLWHLISLAKIDFLIGGTRTRGSRFAQGLGNQMPGLVSERAG